MRLEALYKIFKAFNKEDMKAVYDHYHIKYSDYVEQAVNCSISNVERELANVSGSNFDNAKFAYDSDKSKFYKRLMYDK